MRSNSPADDNLRREKSRCEGRQTEQVVGAVPDHVDLMFPRFLAHGMLELVVLI